MEKNCTSCEQENQLLQQEIQRLKEKNRDYDQQIESLNEENQRLRENNQRVKQENHNYNQQTENLKKEEQRLLQGNRRLEQEIQKCKKKINDLEETIRTLTETIEHQNLRTTASSSTPRTSLGASAMVTSKCKFESKTILKKCRSAIAFCFAKNQA